MKKCKKLLKFTPCDPCSLFGLCLARADFTAKRQLSVHRQSKLVPVLRIIISVIVTLLANTGVAPVRNVPYCICIWQYLRYTFTSENQMSSDNTLAIYEPIQLIQLTEKSLTRLNGCAKWSEYLLDKMLWVISIWSISCNSNLPFANLIFKYDR